MTQIFCISLPVVEKTEENNILNLEQAIRYGRFDKVTKGMSLDEFCTAYDYPYLAFLESGSHCFSFDGLEVYFTDGFVTTIKLNFDEVYESEDILTLDDTLFDELLDYSVLSLVFLFAENQIAFERPYMNGEDYTINIKSSGVKLRFCPIDDDFSEFELYSIEL